MAHGYFDPDRAQVAFQLDDAWVWGASVTRGDDGLYHMFYNGSPNPDAASTAIGYATSPDGRSFTRHASNPILAGDETGFDALQVGYGAPLVVEDTWILYYNALG